MSLRFYSFYSHDLRPCTVQRLRFIDVVIVVYNLCLSTEKDVRWLACVCVRVCVCVGFLCRLSFVLRLLCSRLLALCAVTSAIHVLV